METLTEEKPKKKRKSPLEQGIYQLTMICFNGMNIPVTRGSLGECRERVKRRIAWYMDEFDGLNPCVSSLAPGWEWECTQDGLSGDYDGYLKIRKVNDG